MPRQKLEASISTDFKPANTLFAGRVAYLSDALSMPLASKVDAGNTAMEDAWVLSRMMENYEEDIGDGLAAYERFRRPRHRKVLVNMRTIFSNSHNHLGRAVSSSMWEPHCKTDCCRRLLYSNRIGSMSTM